MPAQGRSVVSHGGRRQRPAGEWRSAHAAVVEGGEPVAVRQAVELWLPRLGRVAEPADEQHVGSFSPSLDPQVDAAGLYHLTHGKSRPRHVERDQPQVGAVLLRQAQLEGFLVEGIAVVEGVAAGVARVGLK